MYTFFLGTNQLLSASEIVAALKRREIAFEITSATDTYLRLTTKSPLPDQFIKILGGTVRITQDVASWNKFPSTETILDSLSPLPPKFQIGLGTVSMSLNIRKVGIELKKAARTRKSKLSFIEPRPSKDFSSSRHNHNSSRKSGASASTSLLNAAQVIFNKLLHEPNAELIFIQEKGVVTLVKTVDLQDITSYELRDTMRPGRDAKVGLLPPKLAQIMINLGLP